METQAFLEIAESDDCCKKHVLRFLRILREIIHIIICVKQLVIIYNSMYPIHQIIHIKVYQKSDFLSCKF